MYLAGKWTTTDVATWADSTSWIQAVVETAAIDTGKTLPTMTKEEAQKQLQELLSWVKK